MAVKQRGSRDDAFARAVAAWQPRARVGLRLGEQRNDVREVWLDGVRCAGRLAVRSAGALDWEIALLLHLDRSGLRVPRPQPAADGRLRVGRLTVFSWLDGVPPTVPRDWQLVADELARLHAVTAGWPQRPDFLAAHDLLTHERGGDVRLDAMPADVVALCRAAWAALPATPRAVVHGDPGAGNIRLRDGRVGLLDWDEARVDSPLFDVGALPADATVPLPDRERLAAHRAAIAWEVACSWTTEPVYARRRLAELTTTDAV